MLTLYSGNALTTQDITSPVDMALNGATTYVDYTSGQDFIYIVGRVTGLDTSANNTLVMQVVYDNVTHDGTEYLGPAVSITVPTAGDSAQLTMGPIPIVKPAVASKYIYVTIQSSNAGDSSCTVQCKIYGRPDVNVTYWIDGAVPATAQTGIPKSDVTYLVGTLATITNDQLNVNSAQVGGATPITTTNIVTALMDDTGITAGGTWTFATIIKVIVAAVVGELITNAGDVYDLKDAEDQTTKIGELTVSETTPFREFTKS